MFSGKRNMNYWPAYADMLMMLFVCCLAVAVYAVYELSLSNSPILPVGAGVAWEGVTGCEECEKCEECPEVDPWPGCEIACPIKCKDCCQKCQGKCPPDCGRCEQVCPPNCQQLEEYCRIKPDEKCKLERELLENLGKCFGSKVEKVGCSLIIQQDDLAFESGKDNLDSAGRRLANQIGECLIGYSHDIISSNELDMIVIEGHSDAVPPWGVSDPIHQDQYNRDLSLKRAEAVYDQIMSTINFNTDSCTARQLRARLATQGFGPYRPHKGSRCAECMDGSCDSYADFCRLDRRVEIKFIGRVSGSEPSWSIICEP
jgi:outer membrane protein OmpA-like peptidoglycan-associated protein